MLTVLTNQDQPRYYGRMVTIQLQPFLPYTNLALKNSYRKGIWLSNIITGPVAQAELI